MFDQLGEKLQSSFKKLTGKGKLSDKDIEAVLREIRLALLEADVNYKVVKSFLNLIKEKALGEEVMKSLTPGQQVVKIVHEELTALLGSNAKEIKFNGNGPTVIMLAGVQGSGKTTSAGKLADFLKRKNKTVVLAACDTQRAAAVDQLKILGEKIGVTVFNQQGATPQQIAKEALQYCKKEGIDILIVDTAGRQHVDEALMDEIEAIREAIDPDEVLFVVDSMMGQQAVDAAQAFDARINITGFILSKADSDARGGAALSVSYITGTPIKFTGTGEKITDFEIFHPDRIASRILGMGDMMSLIEKAQAHVDADEQEALVEKLKKNSFTLEDYLDQLDSIANMGGIEELMNSLPMGSKMGNMQVDPKQISRTKAIIQSMTVKERTKPSIINASRRKRIAAGSGTTVTDVNRLLKGFEQSKKMMKRMSSQKRRFGSPKFPFM